MSEHANAPSGGKAELCLEPRFRKPRLNPIEASDYLREIHGTPVAVSTLAKWRCLKSDGPPFLPFGRSIFYSRVGLDIWVEARLGRPRRSTSEADHA